MANSTIDALTNAGTKQVTANARKTGENVDKLEFMQLLVTQLKNQDPLNPMDNQEFAVQLAQFSSLEQLTAINQKITAANDSGAVSSLASYLGHEVVMNSNDVRVTANDGGSVFFNLREDAASLSADLLRADGTVQETIELGPLSAGEQSVPLSNLATSSGDFKVVLRGTSVTGAELKPTAYRAGIVSGFIPGADPKLILNGSEVGTANIRQVRFAGVK